MKRKVTSFALALIMSFAVIGCGQKEDPAPVQEEVKEEVVEEIQKEDEAEKEEPEAEAEAESEDKEETTEESSDVENKETTEESSDVENKETIGSSGLLSKVCNTVEDGYDNFGSSYGGVIIVQDKNGLYGAIDYEKNEIVPCRYPKFSSPNNKGYFILRDEEGRNLYSPEGELIASTPNSMNAFGNYYAIANNGGFDTVQVYDLEGNLVVETSQGGLEDAWITGCQDGIVLLRRNTFDKATDNQLTEVGMLYEDGKIEWQTEYDGPRSEISSSDDPNANGAGASYAHPGSLFSGLNDGYYLTENNAKGGNEDYKFQVYDADSNFVSEFSFQYMSSDGVYTEGKHYYEGVFYPTGFFYDGAYHYNRGTKTVWNLDENYLLVDLATKKCIAKYAYITMNEGDRWLVSDGDKWGYIDMDGNQLAMYDDASDFSNGYAFVMEDGIAYLIDKDFNKLEEVGAADSVARYGDLLATRSEAEGTTLYMVKGN